jgi:prophage antirepressor-like protein
MDKFIISEFDGQKVRATEDGQFSVFDVLVAFIPTAVRNGKKGKAINPRQVLKSITERNPEVVQFLNNFKFPGRGQRETPITNEEGIYQILMLCPGQRGAEFRKWAANLIERYRKADGSLAEEVVERQTTNQAKRTSKRIEGIVRRKIETDTLQAHGIEKGLEYAICTNKTYTGLFGKSAKELKVERGLRKKESLRDNMTNVELSALSFAESLAAQEIEAKDLYGINPCGNACHSTASDVRSVLRKYQ